MRYISRNAYLLTTQSAANAALRCGVSEGIVGALLSDASCTTSTSGRSDTIEWGRRAFSAAPAKGAAQVQASAAPAAGLAASQPASPSASGASSPSRSPPAAAAPFYAGLAQRYPDPDAIPEHLLRRIRHELFGKPVQLTEKTGRRALARPLQGKQLADWYFLPPKEVPGFHNEEREYEVSKALNRRHKKKQEEAPPEAGKAGGKKKK